MREAFEELPAEGGPERVERAEAGVADLEEELRRRAVGRSRERAPKGTWGSRRMAGGAVLGRLFQFELRGWDSNPQPSG